MKNNKLLIFALAVLFIGSLAYPQTVTVTSPNGGEIWEIGGPNQNITWTSSGITSGNFKIVLLDGATTVGTLANGIACTDGAHSFDWQVGRLMTGTFAPVGSNYTIRVRQVSETPRDHSDGTFTLMSRQPNIRVSRMHDIGWDHTFLPRTFAAGDTVTILYHLHNDSDYSTGPFQVGLRVGGSIIARNAHSELVNGAQDHGQFVWTATCGSPVAVVGDCDGEVSENNEGDNIMTDPDLACTQTDLLFFRDLSCSSGTGTAKAGLRYRFSAQIDAASARADSVRVVGGIVGGAELYNHTFASMAGDGGIEDVSFIWEVPEGAHRVYFEIDPDDTVDESNEGNNRQVMAITGVASKLTTKSCDLKVKITQPRLFGISKEGVEAKVGTAMTIGGKVTGVTRAIRDFKVKVWVKSKTNQGTLVFEKNFNDPGMLVVPFSCSWTPQAVGIYSILVKVELGPHAVGAGMVDTNTRNNSASIIVKAMIGRRTLKKR